MQQLHVGLGLVLQHVSGDSDDRHKLLLPNVSSIAEGDDNVWLAFLVAVLHFEMPMMDTCR